MSSDRVFEFTKANLDQYLKAVAKEYRKLVGKGMPAEMVIIGGASVLLNYGFRDMTTDIDALILAASGMHDAISRVRDQYDLPDGWLNSDFTNTDSYTPKLLEFSKYYRTYSNIVVIRTISAEYLIAMKLRSGRLYKNDLSDVLGILADHEKRNCPITEERIHAAVCDLYGSLDVLPESSAIFLENILKDGNFSQLYSQIAKSERETRTLLTQYEHDNPGHVKKSNFTSITQKMFQKSSRASILTSLGEKKKDDAQLSPSDTSQNNSEK
ncbi:MAG: hypothetical protein IK020_11060 [Clostridiales bacterium]|nr:hypothetical protein [Clostridiales bacterium]